MKKLLSLFVASMMVLGGCANPKVQPPKPHKPENTPTEQQGEYDVYLLIGQSNMAGRGTMLPEDIAAPIEGVYLLDTEGKVVPATNPLNQYSTIRKDMKHQQINPGVAFSKKIYQTTGRKVLLVVNARGGSSISEWAKGKVSSAVEGKSFYDEAVRRTRQATAYGPLKAILWHQGESDSNASKVTGYMDKLVELVSNLRSDLGAVPFVAGEIAPWHTNRNNFNPIIRTISTKIPDSDWVSSEGCDMLIDESDPHFGREGQLLLGERYAEKILKMVYDKE